MFDVNALLDAATKLFDLEISSDRDAEMYVLTVTSEIGIPDGIVQQPFVAESLAFGAQWSSLVDDQLSQHDEVSDAVKTYVQACLRYGFEVYHATEHKRSLTDIAALALSAGVDVDVSDVAEGMSTEVEHSPSPVQEDDALTPQDESDNSAVDDADTTRDAAQSSDSVLSDDDHVLGDTRGDIPRFKRTIPAHNEPARLGISRWEPTGPYEAPEARFRTELRPVAGGRFAKYDTGRRSWDDLDEAEKLDAVEASNRVASDVRTVSEVNKVLSDLALEIVTERMARRGWEFKHKIPLKAVFNAFCAVLVAEDGSLEGLEFSEDELNLIAVISDYRPQFDAVFENMDLLNSKADAAGQMQRNLRSLVYEVQRQNDLNTRLMATLLAERMNLGIVERGMNAQNFSISNDQLDEFIDMMRAQSFEAGQREQRRKGRLIGQEKMRRDNNGM